MDDVIGVSLDKTQECKQKTLFQYVEKLQTWMAKVLLCDFNQTKSDRNNSKII